MRRKSLLILLAAFFVVAAQENATAQKDKYRDRANNPVVHLSYEKKLRWADGLFKAGGYHNAADYYVQLLEEQPRNPYLNYQAAECYWALRDYVLAAKYFGMAYNLASAVYPEAIYKEALMLKQSGEYDKAITRFQKFIDDNPKTYKKLKKRAQLEIDGAKMAKESILKPEEVNIVNLGANVNTSYTELSPMPLGDSAILFATMKSNHLIDANKEKRKDYVSRFMVSKKFKKTETDVVDTFQWPLPFLDGQFNDDKFHVGNGCYSPGGDRFYFTRCLENDSNDMTCRIMVSEFSGDRWGKPYELGNEINQSTSSSTQPYMAKMGKKEVLFFVSNRKLQSRGGYDIWYSVYDTRQKSYRRPQNAGKQVNTEGDEMSPYYDDRVGKLYFASNGWKTMGGFDIFEAKGGPSRYTELQNLGYPINTAADELYYIKDNYGKPDAYVVSNRIGSYALKNPTCCDDIFRVQYEPKLFVQGKVVDKVTNEKIREVVVKMVDETGKIDNFNSANGEFEFRIRRNHQYVFTADKQSYSSERAVVSTEHIKRTDPDDTVFVTIYVDLISIDESMRLDNILYAYDDAALMPESAVELDKLIEYLKDNPSLDVEIHSHTDSKGKKDYNRVLSQKRAESVVDYLVQNGIERSRLTAKGFGDTMPIADNANPDGSDNPEGRQLNRRTEFKIAKDAPERRIIYDSNKPGTIGEQMKNLGIDTDENSDDFDSDNESEFGGRGSRVN